MIPKILFAGFLSLAGAGFSLDGLAFLRNLPDNTWARLPVVSTTAPNVEHTNITVDVDSQRIFYFGSNTHGNVNNNAMWYLRLSDFSWHPVYPDDPLSSYVKVTSSVIGSSFWPATSGGHPPASHVFDAAKYIPGKNCILYLLCDKHNSNIANTLSNVNVTWDNAAAYVGSPAAWLFDTRTLKWMLLKNKPAPDVFTYPMGVSADGETAVASTPGATFQFEWSDSTWSTVTTTGARPSPYATAMEYDAFTQRFVVVGGSQSFTYSSFDPAGKTWTLTQSTGPSMNGAKVGYDTLNHVLIAHCVDGSNSYSNPSGNAITYVRPSNSGQWIAMKKTSLGDSLPTDPGFNSRAEYDLRNNVFYYMVGRELWAYRYKRGPGSGEEGRGQRVTGKGQITVSPNPFTSHISIGVDPGILKLALFDLRGRWITEAFREGRGEYSLNAGKLQPGIYFLQWREEGRRLSKKIVKTN